ncbi:MAG: hypothetical protein HY275_17380 [Gemmatimonadetes bacterium]|nr:hypothetical protein [Gemmatimonadota bacterium]
MNARKFAQVLGTAAMLAVAACGGGGATGPANTGGGGGGGGGTGGTGTPPANTVNATTVSSFNPTQLNISVNTQVSFVFFAVTHNVTFDAVAGAPANIGNSSNTTVQRTFAVQGTFPFNCTLHPGMSGQVVVGP